MSEKVTLAISLANSLLSKGQLDEALAAARDAVREGPSDAGAHNALGTVLAKRADHEAAERAFRESIACDPGSYRGYANLSASLKAAGRLEEALAAITTACERAPDLARLSARRGQLERETQRTVAAAASFRTAYEREPTTAHRDLYARSLFEAADPRTAVHVLEGAVPVTQDGLAILAASYGVLRRKAEVQRTLSTLLELGPKPQTALQLMQLTAEYSLYEQGQALARSARLATHPEDPLHVRAVIVEAGNLEHLGRHDDALALLDAEAAQSSEESLHLSWVRTCARLGRGVELQRAASIALRALPRSVAIRLTLAEELVQRDAIEDALVMLEEVRTLDDTDVGAVTLIASAYAVTGELERAAEMRARAAQLDPKDQTTFTHSLFANLHRSTVSPDELLAEHVRWAERFAVVTRTEELSKRSLDPNRKLKIGFISGDLRSHAVTKFLLPLLTHFDRSTFEIYCYSLSTKSDEVTDAIRALSLTFRDVKYVPPSGIAKVIAEDSIDILIELSGHTHERVLQTLAHRPAPVQASYLGWPATTGLATVDYRITDGYADPPGLTERYHVERLERLRETAWCFETDEALEIVPRPDEGPLIFGSFNRATKLSDETLRAWSRILVELPAALLLLKGRGLATKGGQARVRRLLTEGGVDERRVMMVGWAPSVAQHLANWGDVDIALDSYPYAGTTTTCEALWMGVPVVTRTGAAHVSRVGASLLHQVGLDDLVATDWDGYVERAVKLARDSSRRRALRSSLRERFKSSTLGSGDRFARDFESVLRRMWVAFVESPEAHALREEPGRPIS